MHLEMASKYLAQGSSGPAYLLARRMAERAPDNATARETLGLALALDGRFADAVDELKCSLAIQETPSRRFNLAMVYTKLGRPEEAVVELARTLQLAPEMERARRFYQTLTQSLASPSNSLA